MAMALVAASIKPTFPLRCLFSSEHFRAPAFPSLHIVFGDEAWDMEARGCLLSTAR